MSRLPLIVFDVNETLLEDHAQGDDLVLNRLMYGGPWRWLGLVRVGLGRLADEGIVEAMDPVFLGQVPVDLRDGVFPEEWL